MVTQVTLDPSDQKRRRRRSRITQPDIARRLDISIAAVSEYEAGKKPLPFALTPEDYEVALTAAIKARETQREVEK